MDRGQYNHSFGSKPKLISIDYYPLREYYVKKRPLLLQKVRRQNIQIIVPLEIV